MGEADTTDQEQFEAALEKTRAEIRRLDQYGCEEAHEATIRLALAVNRAYVRRYWGAAPKSVTVTYERADRE